MAGLSKEQPFEPPDDPVFQYLLEQAIYGAIPVFGVVMKPHRLKRYADYYRPETTEEGAQVVRHMIVAWNAGRPVQPWIYPRNAHYIVSDDYFAMAAIEAGRPATIAAQFLGWPNASDILDKQGPLPTEQVKSMIGIGIGKA